MHRWDPLAWVTQVVVMATEYGAARLHVILARKSIDMSEYKQQLETAYDLYKQRDFKAAQNLFESLLSVCPSSDDRRDCLLNVASCLASQGNFRDALERYNSVNLDTYDVRYNRALCNYKLANFDEALDIIDDLLENRDKYQDQPLKECINLKSAIQYRLGSVGAAQQLLAGLEEDGCTLHNTVIYTSPYGESIDGLKRLIEAREKDLPPETAQNLLKLYTMGRRYDLANELIGRHKQEWGQDPDKLELYEILVDRKNVPDKLACKKLDLLLDKLIGDTRKESSKESLIELTTKQLASILWCNRQYSALEKILLKVEPVLCESDFWSIWFAHSLFMQDNRYEECSFLYEKLLSESSGPLDVDPIVLANLCVAYLLTGRNESAEKQIKQIETEESELQSRPSHQSLSHSCFVNLTIGQLYCVKMNYSFGLLRMFKALEPLNERLTSETWFVCKRCILSLLDYHCKSMIYIRDDLFDQIISFLVECERHGLTVKAAPIYEIVGDLEEKLSDHEKSILMGRNSVTYEARYLRSLILAVLYD